MFPSIPSLGLDPDTRTRIAALINELFPGFARDYSPLNHSRPSSTPYVQFAKTYAHREALYIHLISVLAQYMGGADSSDIDGPFGQGTIPAFLTDRIYFRSRIIPIEPLGNASPESFQPRATLGIAISFTKDRPLGFNAGPALFDQPDLTEPNTRWSRRLVGRHEFNNLSLYPPLVLDDFNVPQLNLLAPHPPEVPAMLEAFHHFLQSKRSTTAQQQFWSEYLGSLKFERFLSAHGNPHWKVLHTK